MDAQSMYVALRTLGIFISWIRVYQFIYLLIQTDDVFVSKQNQPLSVQEGKKDSKFTYRHFKWNPADGP